MWGIQVFSHFSPQKFLCVCEIVPANTLRKMEVAPVEGSITVGSVVATKES